MNLFDYLKYKKTKLFKPGISVSYENNCSNTLNYGSSFLEDFNTNLAIDIANMSIITNDVVYDEILSLRPNNFETSKRFHENLFKQLLTNGVAIIHIDQFVVIDGIKKTDIEFLYNEDAILINVGNEFIKLRTDEFIYLEIDLPTTHYKQNFLFTKLLSLYNTIAKTKKISLIFKSGVMLDEEERSALTEEISQPGENGVLLVDGAIEDITQLQSQNEQVDYKALEFITKEILSSRKVSYNVYTNEYTNEEYLQYIFTKILPILEQYEQELKFKLKLNDIHIIHNSFINLSPDQIKAVGMLGIIKIDEARVKLGLKPLDDGSGDVLIKNWNDNSQKGGDT